MPENLSEARGIQNAQTRYLRHSRERLTSNRLLRKVPRSKPQDERETSSYDEETPSVDSTKSTQAVEKTFSQNKQAGLGKPGALRVKNLTAFSKWMGLSVVATSYVAQFIFALLTIFSYGIYAEIERLRETNLLARAGLWLFDFNSMFPTDKIGIFFWGISVLIVVVTFLGFYLWFKIIGIRPFGTVISSFVTFFLLSLCLLPVTNLFPGLILWVIYMNASSMFNKD